MAGLGSLTGLVIWGIHMVAGLGSQFRSFIPLRHNAQIHSNINLLAHPAPFVAKSACAKEANASPLRRLRAAGNLCPPRIRTRPPRALLRWTSSQLLGSLGGQRLRLPSVREGNKRY